MRKQEKKDKYKIVLFLAGMVALMVVFWFVLRFFEERMPGEKMQQDFLTEADQQAWEDSEKDPSGTIKLDGKKYNYYDDIKTYLVMGTDKNRMADFLMLIVLDQTKNTYGFLQLDRDTITEVSLIDDEGNGAATADIQLCTAHWYGGTDKLSCENTVKAVSKMLGGLKIDGYYALDMENIGELNHAIGGVEVELMEDYTYVNKKMKKGVTWTLNDKEAYAYVHDRFGVGDETNQSRMARQRQYMKAFLAKVQEEAKQDINYTTGLYKEMQDLAVTDIKGSMISAMAKMMSNGTSLGMHNFDGEVKTGKALGDGILHAEFYPDADSVVENMTELYGLERDK